jgi:hypothetical protein
MAMLNNQMVKKNKSIGKNTCFNPKKKRLEKTHTHTSPQNKSQDIPSYLFCFFSKPIPNYKSQEKKLSHKFPTKTDGKLVNPSLHYG